MAGKSAAVTLVPASQQPTDEEKDADLAAFMREVNKLLEMEPEKMTGAQHIDRLFRPGAKYFNMNPFEVLGLDWEASAEGVKAAKKKKRKEGAETGSIDDSVPEDDPHKFKMAVKIMISRMFAEFEQRKKQLEAKDKEMKKAAQEAQAEKEFMEALKKKEEALWEKTRQKRVNSWRNWSGNAPKNKLPKLKEEKGLYNAHNDARGEEYKKDWR